MHKVGDLRELLRIMFDVSLDDKSVRRIFDSLDSARNGFLDWRIVLDYMTPQVIQLYAIEFATPKYIFQINFVKKKLVPDGHFGTRLRQRSDLRHLVI